MIVNGPGISIAGNGNDVSHNNLMDNRVAGIYVLPGSTDNRIDRNRAKKNEVGILVTGGDGTAINRNELAENFEDGFFPARGCFLPGGRLVVRNARIGGAENAA